MGKMNQIHADLFCGLSLEREEQVWHEKLVVQV